MAFVLTLTNSQGCTACRNATIPQAVPTADVTASFICNEAWVPVHAEQHRDSSGERLRSTVGSACGNKIHDRAPAAGGLIDVALRQRKAGPQPEERFEINAELFRVRRFLYAIQGARQVRVPFHSGWYAQYRIDSD
jgi:hypothetical protein